MCIFSGEIESVANTRIFAADISPLQQVIIYQMDFSAAKDVAMILPIPVVQKPENGDTPVSFIDLSNYPKIFKDITRAFPVERSRALKATFGANLSKGVLEVHRVGSFDASFVPTQEDMPRLDDRFRLPETIWRDLPQYEHSGFVVFKFRAGSHKVHPMAFSFYNRGLKKFFPTFHIHHGDVPERAHYDHELFIQSEAMMEASKHYGDRFRFLPALDGQFQWEESTGPLSKFLDMEKAGSYVRGEWPVFRCKINGEHANQDILMQ